MAKLQTVIRGCFLSQRTLMKDARRGLYSLVEAQARSHKPVDLLELNEHSPAQVQTFHSSTTSHHTVTSQRFKTSVRPLAHAGHNGAGRDGAYTAELHQLPGLYIFLGDLLNVLVVFFDAFIQMSQLVEHVTHHGVALVSCQGSNAACSLALKPDGVVASRRHSPSYDSSSRLASGLDSGAI
jgi:hypothetical protein